MNGLPKIDRTMADGILVLTNQQINKSLDSLMNRNPTRSRSRSRNPSMNQPIDVTCKICDVPPSHECDGCGHGVCSHPDCCSRYVCVDHHGNRNNRTVTIICSDCIVSISTSIVRVVSREGGRGTMPVAADSK